MAYLDDILVYSRSPEEHLRHLEHILAKLDTEKLYAKLSKCSFGLKSVKFLGHVISAKGISPDPSKVQLVQDWPPPRNVADLRSFVGLASYFRKFIILFASITACLTRLFRKGIAWAWTLACQTAFDTVKTLLTIAPVLKLPDYEHEFTVVVDASGFGIGAVLLQDERSVALDGRELTDTEFKWLTSKQEMLAVVHHLNKWRCYLEGRHFVVVTDHEPNTWFHGQQKLNPRQNRWYEFLAGHDFTWQYRPGRSNMADPLSRHPAFSAILCCGAVATRSQRNATLPDSAVPKVFCLSAAARTRAKSRSVTLQRPQHAVSARHTDTTSCIHTWWCHSHPVLVQTCFRRARLKAVGCQLMYLNLQGDNPRCLQVRQQAHDPAQL